jgi:hypothetical protein
MSKRTLLLGMMMLTTALAAACAPKQVAPTLNPKWTEMTVSATGRGAIPEPSDNPAQAKLMAERAARVDAYRKLSEQIYGLQVRGETTVRDAMLANDVIETSVSSYLRAAEVVETRVRQDLGIVEVDMKLTLGSKFYELFTR